MLLQINEFHKAPVDFLFTSPLNATVLPTLRVSGDGVLKEFGFHPNGFFADALMVWLLAAAFALLTYWSLERAGRMHTKAGVIHHLSLWAQRQQRQIKQKLQSGDYL